MWVVALPEFKLWLSTANCKFIVLYIIKNCESFGPKPIFDKDKFVYVCNVEFQAFVLIN